MQNARYELVAQLLRTQWIQRDSIVMEVPGESDRNTKIWGPRYKALRSACDVLVVVKSFVLPLFS